MVGSSFLFVYMIFKYMMASECLRVVNILLTVWALFIKLCIFQMNISFNTKEVLNLFIYSFESSMKIVKVNILEQI